MRSVWSTKRVESLAFRKQQVAFCILTAFVLAILLLLHTLFAPILGEPSDAVIIVLGIAFSVKALEIIWFQTKPTGISEKTAQIETVLSVIGIFILSGVLAFLTNRDDAPYFVLLEIPILQCAYRFGLVATISSVVGAVGMMFAWTDHYFAVNPPARASEYLETGMIAVIFCLTGPLVWFLVKQLKERESNLFEKVSELESTRERLVAEEKLAAVGRFASGIAHEIRNPVAMIASSLETAAQSSMNAGEREEMFAIAAHEARRLENLTSEFLSYARPSSPQRSPILVADIVRHVADVTKIRATTRSVEIHCVTNDETVAEIDAAQIEGALLNLSLNALDATPSGGRIVLRARDSSDSIFLDVEDSGSMIPASNLGSVFEPFFTTKPGGTGLGLAIARGVAVAHGGDLRLTANDEGAVVFTLQLPKRSFEKSGREGSYGKSSDH